VVAVAVRLEVARAEQVAERAVASAELGVLAPHAVAAHRHAGVEGRLRRAVLREDLDHAAGGVAVQRRARAAQHLDVVDRADVDVGDLALSVREGGRDAVHVDAHAAQPEAGAGAEAAHEICTSCA
jgi:hypothetical protein